MIALPVNDLYIADVLVADESEAQLALGARAGLLQVLIRVSGTQEVEASSIVASALRNPSAYYSQYSYSSTDKLLIHDGVSVPARLLRLQFDPSAISRLLRSGLFPVWGSNRPSVLVWLAVSDSVGRRILGESESGEFNKHLIDQADLRGLPLLFPLLDLEDSEAVSTAEIWGAFLRRVEAASQRYRPDSIISGRLYMDSPDRWVASWSFLIEDRWYTLDDVAFTSREILQRVIDHLANELANQYALDSSRGEVRLRVEAVNSLRDYAELSTYLESLTPVTNSFLLSLENSRANFQLDIEGQRDQLIETIELDEKLMLVKPLSEGNELHYLWLR